MTGTAGGAERHARQFGLELRLGAGHERRMIRAGHRERQGALGAFGFGQLAGRRDLLRRAGNHDLAGAIQVRQHHAGFGADFARGRLIQADDGRHAAVRGVAGFLHEAPALAHHLQPVLKTHRSRRRQRREFAQRQARRGLEAQARARAP